eukprot:1719328-Amphidinium_carterae.1
MRQIRKCEHIAHKGGWKERDEWWVQSGEAEILGNNLVYTHITHMMRQRRQDRQHQSVTLGQTLQHLQSKLSLSRVLRDAEMTSRESGQPMKRAAGPFAGSKR